MQAAALPVDPSILALAAGALALVLAGALLLGIARARRERAETARRMGEIARMQAEMAGRMATFAEVFGARQGDFARMLAERIERGSAAQGEHLTRLTARLAVIDAAQRNLDTLSQQVADLKDVLANKQARGAWGQGRMEAIVRDGLPGGAYAFQASLASGARPDCLVRLPGDPRGLAIDAKFPLEAFVAYRDARDRQEKARAATRVRADVGRHVAAIAERYLVPGETQDVALMFVPAESVHADLQEHFPDVVQRAHRAGIVIVSPALLSLAIQVMQALARDARVREEARVIQSEVGRLVEDIARLADRVGRLDRHFQQAEGDVAAIRAAAETITRRGRRIESLDFADETPASRPPPRRAGDAA